MNYRYRKELKRGYTPVVEENNGLIKYIELGILRLFRGENYRESLSGKEAALVVLGGKGTVVAGGQKFDPVGERVDVFSGPACGLYLPPENTFEIIAETDELEAAICRAPSGRTGRPVLVRPDQVKRKVVGRDNWQREVFDIIDASIEAEKLVVGETINPPGNWSSYPPHKHDIDNPPVESDQEEVYFFRFNPRGGWGFIRLYTGDRRIDEAYALEENDTVLIPEGYHPVASAGGYRTYYLWILAGEKRVLAPNDDPGHAWVKRSPNLRNDSERKFVD